MSTPTATSLDATPADPRAVPTAPRSLGTLCADAARLYARNWRTFLPPVLALEVPILVVKVLAGVGLDPGAAQLDVGYIVRALPFLLILNGLDLIEALLAFVLMALVARQVVDYWARRTTAPRQALREVLPRLRDLLGGSALMIASVGLLTLVGVFLVSGLTLVFVVATAGDGGLAAALQKGLADQSLNLWVNLILLLPILAAVIFLITRWALMVQAVVLETDGPWTALRRSWRLTRGHFWRVLATLVLGSVLVTLLANGPTLWQSLFYYETGSGRGLVLGLLYLVTLAIRIGLLPWVLVLITLLYFDLRLRHGETLDGAS